MKRTGFKMKLLEGYKDEYIKRHREIWPSVVELLRQQGISNYSIFLDEQTNDLYAYQEQSGAYHLKISVILRSLKNGGTI